MKIVKVEKKYFNAIELEISPCFLTTDIEQLDYIGFYPHSIDDDTNENTKAPFKEKFKNIFFKFNQSGLNLEPDKWELFLTRFLFLLYNNEYNIAFYTGYEIKNELTTKYNTEHFIFFDECYSKNKGIYFSINKNEHETFRSMSLFEYYWALNNYTVLLFSKELTITKQVLISIAKNEYNQKHLLAEIQIQDDGEFVECICTQEGSLVLNCAYNRAFNEYAEQDKET